MKHFEVCAKHTEKMYVMEGCKTTWEGSGFKIIRKFKTYVNINILTYTYPIEL